MSGWAVWTAAAVSGVRQRRGTAAGVSGRHCPPRTLPQSADVRCYRKSSSGPRPLGGVQPPPPGPPNLLTEPIAKPLTHVGHGRALQRQGLLGG
jgi:hypothetical protein